MRKILIAEDEVYARKSMKKQIRECMKDEKTVILEAANGKQGLELVREEKPDLVFTDIRMPVMDGLDFLREIKAVDAGIKVVIISAYADFEYAKTALKFGAEEYLLKPIDDRELRECLGKFEELSQQEKQQEIYDKEDGLTRFISANLFSEQPEKDFVNENMFRKIFGEYQILALYFQKGKEPGMEEVFRAVQAVGTEEIFTAFRLVQIQKGLYAVLMYADGQIRFRQKNLIKEFNIRGQTVWGGVSLTHDKSSDISSAYRQAMTALECKVYERDSLLYYQDMERKHTENFLIGEVQRDLLKMALEKGNLHKAKTVVREIFQELEMRTDLNSKSLELFLTQMTVLFHQAAEKTENPGAESRFYKFQLLDFHSIEEIQTAIEEKAGRICRLAASDGGGKGEELIQAMKEYARENCSTDLTIKTLAEKVFFMNPAHLSHLFKEKTGESYSAYLKKIRIQKAKKLLEQNNCSITEVGVMTGYNDTSQFIRVFKQEIGMTPKKYRDEKLKEKELGV